MYQKEVRLIKWDYMINDNENEAENEKYVTSILHKEAKT